MRNEMVPRPVDGWRWKRSLLASHEAALGQALESCAAPCMEPAPNKPLELCHQAEGRDEIADLVRFVHRISLRMSLINPHSPDDP
jgi:hypothetical protein